MQINYLRPFSAAPYIWREDGSLVRYITRLLLISTVCIGILIFIRHLNYTIDGRAQLSLTDDLEASLRAEIEVALAEQRAVIAQEMVGYKYPNGQYNISANSLSDLVLESGGQPVRSFVVTTWRCGSTFLGDILNSHPANWYHYEPLLDYQYESIRGPPLASEVLEKLENLFHCNFSDQGSYLQLGQQNHWWFYHNARFWDRCKLHPRLCWLPQLHSSLCSLFPFQSMKTVRLRLRLAEHFLADTRLNVRVVFLVRDPRGTLESRSLLDWCQPHSDCSDPATVCADLVDDYSAALRFSRLYPQTFKVVRYEDLASQPEKLVPDILSFFGLQFHPDVQQFIRTHTGQTDNDIYSTYRNSSANAILWREKMAHSQVREIQRVCRVALDAWGYLRAHNASHQRMFNPAIQQFSLP